MARGCYTVGSVFLTFFVISLLTSILGSIVQDVISSFRVSLTAALAQPATACPRDTRRSALK